MILLTDLFFLLQVPAQVPVLTETDPLSVLAWVSSILALGFGTLGWFHLKKQKEHTDQIIKLNEDHRKELAALNELMRTNEKENTNLFFEYSQMLQNAVGEVAKAYPEIEKLHRDLIDSIEGKNEKLARDIIEKLAAIIEKIRNGS